ncbi:hypothetical protein DBR47_00615 [Paucibacter sp. KBW04]|uniref:hypothetical protein n=1 Tax=Paucibacter sp. KBW04 TaxID=2153361 RepID=UPI000F5653B8|nr:hypothetical protein [Paucibacter sp. KBW04]RQO63109.1 hypothetical protein DBR47_00615 [Paucibacter sp. KBW04]
MADRIVFVASSQPDAPPVNMMVLGTVNGVATLVVPASRIGDLAVNTFHIANNAVTVPLGASLSSDWVIPSSSGEYTLLNAGYIDTGGAPLFVLFNCACQTVGDSMFSSDFTIRVKVNGTVVAQAIATAAPSVYLQIPVSVSRYVPSPGGGPLNVVVTVQGSGNGGSFTAFANQRGGTSMLVIGTKK